MMDISDYKKYHKQIILPEIGVSGMKIIKDIKICLIGVGGVGCPMILSLASIGVKNFTLIDGDKVELSNLARQNIFTNSDIGKNKAKIAAEKLSSHFDDLKINFYPNYFSQDLKNHQNIIDQCDIVIDTSDNFKTHFFVNKVSLEMKKAFMIVSAQKFIGNYGIFQPESLAEYGCFRCIFDNQDENENCENQGIIATVTSVIANLALNDLILTLIEKKIHNSFVFLNAQNLSLKKMKRKKNGNCVDCKNFQ